MATDQIIAIAPLSYVCAVDMTNNGYRAVTLNSSGQLVLPSAGGTILGVLYDHPKATYVGRVYPFGSGELKCIAGGTVNPGDLLKVDATGAFLTASGSDVTAGAAVAMAVMSAQVTAGAVMKCVLLGAAGAAVGAVAIETVTSGALSATTPWSRLSVTGPQAFTLPNGTFDGQTKNIECIVAATSPAGTLTITTPQSGEPATHVFSALLQRLALVWYSATGWHVTGKHRQGTLAVTVGTTVLTGQDMVEAYSLTIVGSVSSTGVNAIPAALVNGEMIEVRVASATSTPVGAIDCAARTLATGANTTHFTAISATSAYFVGEWQSGQFLGLATTGITFS